MKQKKLKYNIRKILLMMFIFLGIGAVGFSVLEGWDMLDSFYFATMTATTVGYGDFTPSHPASKIFTMIYSLLIIPFILYAFNVIARYEVERVNNRIQSIKRKQTAQNEIIEGAESELERQRKIINKQQRKLSEQEKKLEEQERINQSQSRKLKGQEKKIKIAEKEIEQHNTELEIVEDFVEEKIAKEIGKGS